ncbi:MAG: glycosyltransferase family 2 protein [Vicingaceae bacterium]|nr:glycosyltransferase family 2 protein [Vicingaceae bacterium]
MRLVSIVMPVKNTAAFLEECLTSILNQTYSNWELLAVNDNSNDNSFEILSEFSQKDKRIQVFNTDGNGIIDALSLAYSKSSGDYISRMDSDDVMLPKKIELMLEDLQKKGTGYIALGLVKYFSKDGIGEGFSKYEAWLNGLTKQGSNFSEIYKECVVPSPCWMVDRVDFEKCGGFNSEIYPEDYDLVFRFYQQGLKCLPSNALLHLWRDYPTRTSRTDKNYADSSFIEIKTNYFLQLHYDKSKNLVVWGAGKKGKSVAELLLKNDIPFHWVCDNPKKIGKTIYDQEMLSFTALDDIDNIQSIVSVASPLAQKQIQEYFSVRKQESMKDYFFFC